jgi:hypothetical protein
MTRKMFNVQFDRKTEKLASLKSVQYLNAREGLRYVQYIGTDGDKSK